MLQTTLMCWKRKKLLSAHSLFSDDNWTFHDENAPCHHAKRVQHWYRPHKVEIMGRPAKSLDINSIEKLW